MKPMLLRDKLERIGVDQHLTARTLDYLTNQPQYVRLRDCKSDMVVCSTGPCREWSWLRSSSPSTQQTSPTTQPTATCKSSLTTLQSLASSQMGTTENTENWLRTGAGRTASTSMQGKCTLLLHQWTSGEWTLRWWNLTSTWASTWINWPGLTIQMHYTRKARADSICWGDSGLLEYRGHSWRPSLTLWSAVFYGVICWGSSILTADRKKPDRQVKKISSVLGCLLDSVEVTGERRMMAKLSSLMENMSHPIAGHSGSAGQLIKWQAASPAVCEVEIPQVFLPPLLSGFTITLSQ